MMSERDFIYWLKGFLVGKESLDTADVGFIESQIRIVFDDKQKETEKDLSRMMSEALRGVKL